MQQIKKKLLFIFTHVSSINSLMVFLRAIFTVAESN